MGCTKATISRRFCVAKNVSLFNKLRRSVRNLRFLVRRACIATLAIALGPGFLVVHIYYVTVSVRRHTNAQQGAETLRTDGCAQAAPPQATAVRSADRGRPHR